MKKTLSPAVKNLVLSIISLVFISAVFYHYAEGWAWIDSVYVTILTITTVGHSTLIPNSATAKIYTSAVAFIGIAMVLTLFGIVSSHYVRMVSEKEERILGKRK
ncbi:TPA: two pore domain potassium channel family protein [Candidatus Woesearchaeota archaeon]|nr:two pore domain potassium channel family protein [Candidatus Woesearchaeota archaeon]